MVAQELEELGLGYRHKWDQRQCSFCGNNNTQFVCWRCFQESIDELQNRVETLEKQVKELTS